jgi:hypothetical protein
MVTGAGVGAPVPNGLALGLTFERVFGTLHSTAGKEHA